MRSHFYSMYPIRRDKGGKTSIFWMPTLYLEPHTHYLIFFTYEIGITAPIWDTRNLKKRNSIWMCLKPLVRIPMQNFLCSSPYSMFLGIWAQPDLKRWTVSVASWSPRVLDSKLIPSSIHYMALGKSLNLASISLFLSWGMISRQLLGLWNKMIKYM